MVDIGDLVMVRGKDIGVVVDKKIIQRLPYAAPIDSLALMHTAEKKRYPEALVVLCLMTSGKTQWIDPELLTLVKQGAGGI